MTRISNVETQCFPGGIEGWVGGHFPLSTLQNKMLVLPCSWERSEFHVVTLSQCQEHGQAGLEGELPGSCSGRQP